MSLCTVCKEFTCCKQIVLNSLGYKKENMNGFTLDVVML